MKEVINLKVNNRGTLLGSYLLSEVEKSNKLFYTTISAHTLQQNAENNMIMRFHSKHIALGTALRLIETDCFRLKLKQALLYTMTPIPTPRLTVTSGLFSLAVASFTSDRSGNIWFNNGTT